MMMMMMSILWLSETMAIPYCAQACARAPTSGIDSKCNPELSLLFNGIHSYPLTHRTH
eukprot:SAG31_NODE_2645_length_5313_cov_6.731300_5_plen_58_part_00